MYFHHKPLDTEEITENMEKNGYALENPVIDPNELKSLCEGDTILMQCYESMISYCYRYAHDVFNMLYEQKIIEEMREKGEDTKEAYEEMVVIDANRHLLHNALMDSINLVSRELAKKNKDNSWLREIIGNKQWEYARAEYATFALLTFYKLYSRVK